MQGKDCPVDEEIGLDDPNNVFSCLPSEECCTKEKPVISVAGRLGWKAPCRLSYQSSLAITVSDLPHRT